MDEPTNPLNAGMSRADQELRDELQAARGVVSLLLISMTCIAAAVSVYLYRQVVNLNQQVIESQRVVNTFQSTNLPKMNWFVENLKEFSKTNPDFIPILNKYNMGPGSTPPGGNAPAAAPAQAPKK